MNWQEFKHKWFDLGCFGVHQVYAWQPSFDRNNLVHWLRKNYLVRLRRGWYAFPEYLDSPGMAEYFAGKIYAPSYISLHSALSFYGLIPEAVVQITSVTTLKTAAFKNIFGEYSYKSLREDLMFGYIPRVLADGKTTAVATLEKALLDLLYLYPFYDNEDELAGLRLDGNLMHAEFNRDECVSLAGRFRVSALEKRMHLLFKVYGI